ncbi:MAG: ATP-binding protein [Acidimicrobiia bacterium]
MTAPEFDELLRRGEPGGVEFKGSVPRESEGRFKIVRAALGLSNRQDGGFIVLGVDEDAERIPVPVGVTPDVKAGWTYDNSADLFSEYADPRIRFEIDHHESDGRVFIVFRIHEFDELPVLCKRDGPGLRRGTCYVRPRGRAQTVEVATHEDMRELIDLATEKALRRLLRRVDRAGGEVIAPEEGDSYAAETEGFL